MGVAFFIGPDDIAPNYDKTENKFVLDAGVFAHALQTKWKNVQITEAFSSEYFVLDWQCTTNHPKELWGSLFRDSCTITLDKPDIEDVAEFAIWFRTIVPSHIPLAIYNDAEP